MTCLLLGAGLVGSQIARILVERGERPVLMDRAPQPQAIGAIVDLARVTLAEGDVLQPLSLARILREHRIEEVVHLAANPMLTIGAQRDAISPTGSGANLCKPPDKGAVSRYFFP